MKDYSDSSTSLSLSMTEEEDTSMSIPEKFICPLTLDTMEKPVMTKSGFNFERTALLRHLASSSGLCPLTRQPLSPCDILPNRALEQEIKGWQRRNGRILDESESEGVDDEVRLNADQQYMSFHVIEDDSFAQAIQERAAKREQRMRRQQRKEAKKKQSLVHRIRKSLKLGRQ